MSKGDVKRFEPTKATLRQLFAFSGNLCAFPNCKNYLLNEKGVFVGQVCHIEGVKGERFNPKMTNEERRHPSNLVLMCYEHHQETNDEKVWTVEKMRSLKEAHEALPAATMRRTTKRATRYRGHGCFPSVRAFLVGDPIRFRALEGGKSAFSATEYRIQPFKISLTNSGKTRLLRCLAAHPDRFDWFTAEELEAGVNATGAKAFVDAIRHQGIKLDPASHDIALSEATPLQEPIDIPGNLAEPFSIGPTGRERQVHVPLESDDVCILAWLLALRRGEVPSELASNVAVVRGSGWVLVEQDDVFSRLKALAAKLEAKGLHLLDFHERAVRLNAVVPYFSPALLSLEIHDERRGKAYSLTLSRRSLKSSLGIIPPRTATMALPEILGNAIYSLAQNAPGPALDNMDTVKRMQRDIRPFLDGIGARLLVRQVDGVPELAVAQFSNEQ